MDLADFSQQCEEEGASGKEGKRWLVLGPTGAANISMFARPASTALVLLVVVLISWQEMLHKVRDTGYQDKQEGQTGSGHNLGCKGYKAQGQPCSAHWFTPPEPLNADGKTSTGVPSIQWVCFSLSCPANEGHSTSEQCLERTQK